MMVGFKLSPVAATERRAWLRRALDAASTNWRTIVIAPVRGGEQTIRKE